MMGGPYPASSDGFPAGNYLQADERARPQFSDGRRFAATDEPAVVIIGAGYTGLSSALHLAELQSGTGSSTRIVLLDSNRVASGPSGKSAGHICGLQAPDDLVRRVCGPQLGDTLIEAAADAANLVRARVDHLAIPCDLRDGYVTIHSDGRQTVTEDGSVFAIDPYPFSLGIAFAAQALGVEIHEGVEVTDLQSGRHGCLVATSSGVIPATFVLACGGHHMAEIIPRLAPIRSRTIELRVSTIVTDPLPDDVLLRVMPGAAGRRFSFANDIADVAYGSIDRCNRLTFGACATACRDPDFGKILCTLDNLLPSLLRGYRDATGRTLGWQKLVEAERLCFTRNRLPNVGVLAECPNVLYVHALGGHGLALGVLLGKAAAEKVSNMQRGGTETPSLFDAFAAVPHGWMPPWQPWRNLVGAIGLMLR